MTPDIINAIAKIANPIPNQFDGESFSLKSNIPPIEDVTIIPIFIIGNI